MLVALALYFTSLASPVPGSTACEELGPRSDGSYVTVCDGSVVRVRDSRGNSREWNHATGTITARSPGAASFVLEAPRR